MKISKKDLSFIIESFLFEQNIQAQSKDQEAKTNLKDMSKRKPATKGADKIGLTAIPINVGNPYKVFLGVDSGTIVGTLIDKQLGDMFLINFPSKSIDWNYVSKENQNDGVLSKVTKSDVDIAYSDPKQFSYERLYKLLERGTLAKVQVSRTKVGGESEQLPWDRYEAFQKQWDHLEEKHPNIALGIRILDPTGATGWSSLAKSYVNWKSEGGIINKHTVSFILDIIGVIPILKISGVIKVPGIIGRIRHAKEISKAAATGKKSKVLGAIGESFRTVDLRKLFGSTEDIQALFLYLNKTKLPPSAQKVIKEIADNPEKLKHVSESIWKMSGEFDQANKIAGHILYPITSASVEIQSDFFKAVN
jgi:hypothetical protein